MWLGRTAQFAKCQNPAMEFLPMLPEANCHHQKNWPQRAPQPQPLPRHVTWLNTCKKWSHVQQQFAFILHCIHHIPSNDESSSTPSEKQCSQSKCKTILPPRSTFKTCVKFHNNKLRKRGRGNERRKGRGVYIGRSTFRQHLKMVVQETEMWNGCTHSDDQRLRRWTWVSNFIPGSLLFENSSKRRGGVLPACRNLSQLWTSIQIKLGSVTDNVGELNCKHNVLSSACTKQSDVIKLNYSFFCPNALIM